MYIAAAVAVATALYANNRQKAAQRKARKEQKEDQAQARKAEVFAETEGSGLGQFGEISLDVEREVDDDELESNVRI
jgi:ribosomal protein L12E/L44/L45/RPP1/RPP2